jgi:hypothetical protein
VRWSELEEGDVVHSGSETFVLLVKEEQALWLCLNTGSTFKTVRSNAEVASWWRIDRKRK